MLRPRPRVIKQALSVDRTGKPRWRSRPLSHFKNEHSRNVFNAQWPGKIAGTISPEGTRRIHLTLGRQRHNFSTDVIAHVIKRGKWPSEPTKKLGTRPRAADLIRPRGIAA